MRHGARSRRFRKLNLPCNDGVHERIAIVIAVIDIVVINEGRHFDKYIIENDLVSIEAMRFSDRIVKFYDENFRCVVIAK